MGNLVPHVYIEGHVVLILLSLLYHLSLSIAYKSQYVELAVTLSIMYDVLLVSKLGICGNSMLHTSEMTGLELGSGYDPPTLSSV